MKVERARRESLQDKETFTEFTKRFTAENFVDQVRDLKTIHRNCIIYNYFGLDFPKMHLHPRVQHIDPLISASLTTVKLNDWRF